MESSSPSFTMVYHDFYYGLPALQDKQQQSIKDRIFFKVDYLHLAQKITELLQKNNLPFKLNETPIQDLSYQCINALSGHQYELLPSYRFYQDAVQAHIKTDIETLKTNEPKLKANQPKLMEVLRIHRQVHIIACNILSNFRKSSEEEKKTAIEDIKNTTFHTLLSGFAQINRNFQLEVSHEEFVKKAFNDYKEAYKEVERICSSESVWNNFPPELQRAIVIHQITEADDTNLPNGKMSLATDAKALIRLGYVVENGEVVLNKLMIPQKEAKKLADEFAETTGIRMKHAYSKKEFFSIQKEIHFVKTYLEKYNLSLEERNAIKPYQDLLNQKAAQPIFDDNDHRLTDVEKKVLKEQIWEFCDKVEKNNAIESPQEQISVEKLDEEFKSLLSDSDLLNPQSKGNRKN
ncbi:MAG: hypothetical protein R3E91_03230 [Chlamydiales bacterium]